MLGSHHLQTGVHMILNFDDVEPFFDGQFSVVWMVVPETGWLRAVADLLCHLKALFSTLLINSFSCSEETPDDRRICLMAGRESLTIVSHRSLLVSKLLTEKVQYNTMGRGSTFVMNNLYSFQYSVNFIVYNYHAMYYTLNENEFSSFCSFY